MIAFVLDASALVALAFAKTPDPDLVRRTDVGSGVAPEIIDLEALRTLRRLERGGADPADIARAQSYVRDAPIGRIPHRPLTTRIWDLRATLTTYDAAYVVLAERFGVPLLTCDAKLARAHGHRSEVVVYPTS